MKKWLYLPLLLLLYTQYSVAQDLGYKTVDIGGEIQWQPKSSVFDLHLAYNFPIHHSLQLRLGYTKSNWKEKGRNDFEEGGGPGGSFGYRYYIMVKPNGYFLGLRSDLWRETINYKRGITNGKSKIWALQTSIELGYLFLINDLFFITPSLTCGSQTNIKTEGRPVGEGFMLLLGLSAGWKF